MATPAYEIGDSVYLRESAALGFLEHYNIASIYQPSLGRIIYYMVPNPARERGATFGDQITHMSRPILYFEEDELITYAEAIQLAKANAQAQLQRLQNLSDDTSS